MENKEEEEIVKKWEEQEEKKNSIPERPQKKRRLREIENAPAESGRVIEIDDIADDENVFELPKTRGGLRQTASTYRRR